MGNITTKKLYKNNVVKKWEMGKTKMKTIYKGYTLIMDFSKDGIEVPTYVKELGIMFNDIAQAKNYIDKLEG